MTSEPKWSRCHRFTGRGPRVQVHAESLVAAAGLLPITPHSTRPMAPDTHRGPALRRLARYARTLNSEQPGERTWEHPSASQLGPSWLVRHLARQRNREAIGTALLCTCRTPKALADPLIGACGPTKLCPGSRRHGWGLIDCDWRSRKHQQSGCGNVTHTCRGMHVRLGLSNEAWPVG